MGWETTRRLKLFPVNGDINSIDIKKLLLRIDETARSLSSQIVCKINSSESCYDVSFNSSKLSGQVIVDPTTTILWELLSFEETPTLIGEITNQEEVDSINYDTALFSFDQIRIHGNQSKLEAFYDEYFPKWKYYLSKNKFVQYENHSTLNSQGFYTACNQTEIGDDKRRNKLNERINKQANNYILNENLFETHQIIEEVIPKHNYHFKIDNIINLTKEFEYENKFEALNSLELYYKGRRTKFLEWFEWEDKNTNKKGALWRHWSGDSWQNCVNPNFMEFKQKIKADNKP